MNFEYPNWIKPKQRQLYKHFYLFLDRSHVDKTFVPTRDSWTAFIESESYGKASLSPEELNLAAPWFRAKANWEITLQSVWQELADTWASGWGWDAVMRHNISCVWREGGDRMYMRALFKIRHKIQEVGFVDALVSYTGIGYEDKMKYLARRELVY